MKDYGRAIESYSKAIELGFAPAHEGLASTYGKMKKFDDMRREYATWVELSKDSIPLAKLQGDVGIAYCMGDKATLSRLLTDLEVHFQDDGGPSAYQIGTLWLYLGENDKGFEWLERSYSMKEYSLTSIKLDPDFDGVRTDLKVPRPAEEAWIGPDCATDKLGRAQASDRWLLKTMLRAPLPNAL